MQIDAIIEFKKAMHLKIESAKDNIYVTFKRIDGKMAYRVNRMSYNSFETALAYVKALETQIVHVGERV